MSTPRLIAALLVAVAVALPSAAVAQTQAPARTQPSASQQPGTSRPPVDLGGGHRKHADPARRGTKGKLPETGSDPRLLFLTGLALTLLGVGLRLRTADADVY